MAEYDFTSESGQALSFSVGDTLVLYCRANQDWWRGNKDGEEGLIAASYIRLVTPEQLAAIERAEAQRKQGQTPAPKAAVKRGREIKGYNEKEDIARFQAFCRFVSILFSLCRSFNHFKEQYENHGKNQLNG